MLWTYFFIEPKKLLHKYRHWQSLNQAITDFAIGMTSEVLGFDFWKPWIFISSYSLALWQFINAVSSIKWKTYVLLFTIYLYTIRGTIFSIFQGHMES